MEGKLEKWRAALTEAANLSGYDLQNLADGYESKFIENIVEGISEKQNPPYLYVADYQVGIESRVQDLNMLSLGSDNVHMVGIWGIGGIGKTTIAKAMYNQIRLKFEGKSFLANVRETSKQPDGLFGLQKRLLYDILMNEHADIKNVDHGIEVIKQRLWCRRVLVVLDDVDDFEQLKALAIRRDLLHSGSRIIVTTRDKSLLNKLKVDKVYTPKLLNLDDSLQLFSWHAFGNDHPKEDYMELSREVVGYAQGLPLVLVVWGSLFKDTISVPQWEITLERLKKIPPKEIQEKLRISYDSLDDEEKNLFLDIACFYVGMDKNYTIKILKGCGLVPEYELVVLSRRCLIRIFEGRLMMHDMIRDMGREIVRRECPEEPGKRSRLWFHEDVLEVLRNHTGTKAVEGLVLNLPRSNDILVEARAFAKMNKLRLLKLNHVSVSGSYEHHSKRLSWLYWFGCPLKSIPSNLFMEKVVAIDMPYSSLKQVWKGKKILGKLKFLNLSHSYFLTKTPDFSGATGLETLLLNDCTRLVEVHQSIKCLDKLVVLDLKNCKNLGKLPLGIWKLTSLQNQSLSGCSKLEKLPRFERSQSKSWFSPFLSWASRVRNPSHSLTFIQGLISLQDLDLANCNFSYIPDELGNLISLKWLDLSENKNLRELPLGIWKLTSLQFLYLSGCSKLEKMSRFKGSPSKSQVINLDSISLSLASTQGLISLRELCMEDCNLSYVPDEFGNLISLEWLDLSGNKNLRELPLGIWKLTSLVYLSLSRCSKLENMSRFKGSPSKSQSQASSASTQGIISFKRLYMENCYLSYVPDELGSFISLTRLKLRGNNFCTLPASISHLSQLWLLDVSHCTRLQSLPELPINLGTVVARNCISLERISIGSNFRKYPLFNFSCCHKLEENNIASIFRSLLQNQEQSEFGEFSIIFPGGEVPDYFNYQSERTDLSFVVSLPPDRKIRGWNLCLVFAGCIDQCSNYYRARPCFFYDFKNKTKGFKTHHTLKCFDFSPIPQDHLWVHHVPQPRKELQVEDGDEVEYNVHWTQREHYGVKKWGFNLIYEDDEKDQAMIEALAYNNMEEKA